MKKVCDLSLVAVVQKALHTRRLALGVFAPDFRAGSQRFSLELLGYRDSRRSVIRIHD